MKLLLCTPYLESPDVVSSGIGTWARNIMSYNQENGSSIDIIPVSFDRHTHIEEYTVGGFKRYYSGIKEVGRSVIKAIRRIKRDKPDIIHVCTSGHIAFFKDILLARIARRKEIRSVVHFHFGRVPDIIAEKGFEYKLLKIVLRIADTVVVIDGKSFKALTDLGYKNVVFIPNPINDSFIQKLNSQEPSITRERKLSLFVGHVIPTKGVAELVEGCRKVPELRLRIVGKCSADMKEKLYSLAKARDNGEWMTVVGEIPHSDIIGEMLRADTFVFPSYTEAFPNVILEAMACGCAIASSNVGAIPEMLSCEDGTAGICYPPESADEVACALNTLYADDAYRKRMAAMARKKVLNTYTVERIWPQLKAIWGM